MLNLMGNGPAHETVLRLKSELVAKGAAAGRRCKERIPRGMMRVRAATARLGGRGPGRDEPVPDLPAELAQLPLGRR